MFIYSGLYMHILGFWIGYMFIYSGLYMHILGLAINGS